MYLNRSHRKKFIYVNFVNWKLIIIQHVFSFWSLSLLHLQLFWGGILDPFFFHSLIKSIQFLSMKTFYVELHVLKKIIDNMFIHNSLLMFNSISHFSLIHCTHSWAVKLIVQREISYLCAPMYISYLLYLSPSTCTMIVQLSRLYFIAYMASSIQIFQLESSFQF